MIAQHPRTSHLALALLIGLSACSDYATQDDLTAVEQKVETVEHTLQRTRREIQDTVSDTRRAVDDVAMRQAVTEAAVVAMGAGFNELALAVQDAHETSLDVYESQQRLVSDVEARLADVALEPVASPQRPERSFSRYVGQGKDLQKGAALPLWSLDLQEQSLTLQREDGVALRYNLRQAGPILYALDEAGRAAACFEQLADALDSGDSFQATDCQNRYALYQFSPALVTPMRSSP